MKKSLIAISTIAMALTLSACSDATANISDGKEALVTVNGEKITKGDIYTASKGNAGQATLNTLRNEIYKKEGIEATDEIKKKAQEQLKTTKDSLKDSFETQLKNAGYKDENDFMEKAILPTFYQSELQKKYVSENKEALLNSYKPVKAQIFQSSDEEKAKKALEALKDGESMKDTTKKYGVTTTYDGSEKVYHSESGLPTEIYSALTSAEKPGLNEKVITVTDSSNTKTYYIIKLVSKDTADFEEDALQAIADTKTIATDATKHYFKKYDLNIYDIDVYNALKTYLPE